MFDQFRDDDSVRKTVKYGSAICLPAMLAVGLTNGKGTPICLGVICVAYLFLGFVFESKWDPAAVKHVAILSLVWSLLIFIELTQSIGVAEAIQQTLGLHAAESEGFYQVTVSAPAAAIGSFWLGMKMAKIPKSRGT